MQNNFGTLFYSAWYCGVIYYEKKKKKKKKTWELYSSHYGIVEYSIMQNNFGTLF